MPIIFGSARETQTFLGALVIGVGAILIRKYMAQFSFKQCLLMILCSAFIADFSWIAYEVSFVDRTSHNLAPFEIVFSLLYALMTGSLGLWLGGFLRPRNEDRNGT